MSPNIKLVSWSIFFPKPSNSFGLIDKKTNFTNTIIAKIKAISSIEFIFITLKFLNFSFLNF